MKVTLDLNSVVDFMLAESAVAAVLRRNGFSSNPPLLSFDHRHAIRRIALTAAATVVAVPELAAVVASLDLPSLPEVSGDDSGPCIITLTFKDDIFHDISSEVVAHYFRAALVAQTLSMLSLAAGDYRRAEGYKELTRTNISTLSSLAVTAKPFCLRQSYY